jgi:Tol biopolymer transport system component
VFSSNRRADLQQQVFAVPAGGGPARNVSRRPAFMNSGPAAAAGSVVYGSGSVTGDGQPSVWLVTRSGVQRRLVAGTAPLLSPDGTRVLYASPQHDALFVLDLRSGAKSQLADVGPPAAWSPDGRWIAYGYANGVELVRADGGERRRLLSTFARVRAGAWSPDGRRLVVETTIFSDEPEAVLTIVDVSTGEATALGKGVQPVWSPEGKRIAFVQGEAIVTVRADGSDPVQATHPPAADADSFPVWSPGGAGIAFVRRHPLLDSTSSELGVVDVASGTERFLTPAAGHLVDPFGGIAWSDDGETLLYASRSLRDVFHLFTTAANLRGVRQLTRGAGSDREPVWAPDGRRIAFVRNGNQLVVLDRGRTRVVARAAGLSSPTWSADGRRLAYAAGGVVWIVHGKATTRVVTGSQPAWSPSGRWIAYVRGGLRLVHPDGTGDRWVRADEEELVFNSPAWSPRSTVVYYISAPRCRVEEFWPCSDFSGAVAGLRPFAHPVSDVRLPSFAGGKPGVSPDGRFFVFGGLTRVPISGAGLFFGPSSYATDVEPDWQRVKASRARRAVRRASR